MDAAKEINNISILVYQRRTVLYCSYGVSSLVGAAESHPSQWVEVPVPPRLDTSLQLAIKSVTNNTAVLAVQPGVKNQNCRVKLLSLAVYQASPCLV